jgi:hypothetical protein
VRILLRADSGSEKDDQEAALGMQLRVLGRN